MNLASKAKYIAAVLLVATPFIAGFEGLRQVAWHDPIDPKGVNTVCYGHIEGVQVGDTYTKVQCQEMLKSDLPRYMAMVDRQITVQMPPQRYAAILSFTYNVGEGALKKSSVRRHMNAGRVQEACDALLLYNKSTGVVRRGLVRRREAERVMCLIPDNDARNRF